VETGVRSVAAVAVRSSRFGTAGGSGLGGVARQGQPVWLLPVPPGCSVEPEQLRNSEFGPQGLRQVKLRADTAWARRQSSQRPTPLSAP